MKLSGVGYIMNVDKRCKENEDGDKTKDFHYALVQVVGMAFDETVFTTEKNITVNEEKQVICNFVLKNGKLALKSVEDIKK